MSIGLGSATPYLTDSNGNEILEAGATASAVNHVKITNAATGNDAIISAVGGDTNAGIQIRPKGSGTGSMRDSSGNKILEASALAALVSAGVPGTTATLAAAGGVIDVDTTQVGNVGSGEDDLISFTMPASVLGTNGDHLVWRASGSFAANANNKQIKAYLGGTQIFSSGAAAFNGVDWSLEVVAIRIGATTVLCTARWVCNSSSLYAKSEIVSVTTTLSNTTVLKCTGEATSDNDITQKAHVVHWFPNRAV